MRGSSRSAETNLSSGGPARVHDVDTHGYIFVCVPWSNSAGVLNN
jgi:hypothetical protein